MNNKKLIIAMLIDCANGLDAFRMHKEADMLTKLAQNMGPFAECKFCPNTSETTNIVETSTHDSDREGNYKPRLQTMCERCFQAGKGGIYDDQKLIAGPDYQAPQYDDDDEDEETFGDYEEPELEYDENAGERRHFQRMYDHLEGNHLGDDY